jgi:ketosteroid isomerase-like protein
MNEEAKGAETDESVVRRWLADWGAEVAARDFDSAERRFDDDVVGFGTRAAIARGRAELRSDQWEHVWPAIDGFGFDAAAADVWISPDRRQAVIAAPWYSQGRTGSGQRFPRGGRATVVLGRATADADWVGQHTHFSLDPIDPGTYTGGAG